MASSEQPSKGDGSSTQALVEPSKDWALNFILRAVNCQLSSDWTAPWIGIPVHDAEGVTTSVLGSMSQGLSLLLTQEDGNFISDCDIMATLNLRVVESPLSHAAEDKTVIGYSNTTDTHSGHLRIRPNEDLAKPQDVVNRESGKYLRGGMLTGRLPDWLKSYGDIVVDSHGPTNETSASRISPAKADLVVALKCPKWPAAGWTDRERNCGWPSKALVTKIVSEGCHIVSKAHPTSSESDAEIEFRYSFSVAEVEICHELCGTQKSCFILSRLMLMNKLKVDPALKQGLSSYHLKTALWWMCEEIPSKDWTRDTIGKMLLALLDKLIQFLRDNDFPNYFMPENNMISHLLPSTLNTLISRIEAVKADPIAFLFFSVGTLQNLFRDALTDLFRPLIDVQDHGDSDSRIRACVCALQNVARSVVRTIDRWNRWKVARIYMEEQSMLLKQLELAISPSLLLTILLADVLHTELQLLGNRDNIQRLDEHTILSLFHDEATFLLARRQFQRAIPLLQRSQHLPGGLAMLAVCYKELGETEKAAEIFRTFTSQNQKRLQLPERLQRQPEMFNHGSLDYYVQLYV